MELTTRNLRSQGSMAQIPNASRIMSVPVIAKHTTKAKIGKYIMAGWSEGGREWMAIIISFVTSRSSRRLLTCILIEFKNDLTGITKT